jgi:uncharacterized protein
MIKGSRNIEILLPLDASEDKLKWRTEVSKVLNLPQERIRDMRLRRRSIDARQKQIKLLLKLEIGIDVNLPEETLPSAHYPLLPAKAPVAIIVGSGPAGLFAALRSIELGVKPIVFERGKDVSSRRFDLAPLLRKGRVVEDSNYCFGEGGAGTFSDGKLYTRSKKRGPVASIYRTLIAHGAPQNILTDAHPHIGSNLLPNVVKAMRQSILDAGGELHFQTKITDFIQSNHRIQGVVTQQGQAVESKAVILATGHSARDIYGLLKHHGITLSPKPFALGVRIEHPQLAIDRFQYHLGKEDTRDPQLPAANYRLATKIKERGVHSFCMCPGGFIVPATTENDAIVLNGMSLSRRDSPFANSGLVVTVEPEDTLPFDSEYGALSGIAYQRHTEKTAKLSVDCGQTAPAQRVTDFMAGRISHDLPDTSYRPGVASRPLDQLLPSAVAWRLKDGLRQFGSKMPGYITREALLVGFETRTSAPVRIPRDPDTLQHVDFSGLYPCGEGAGYAGGIVSAALDGLRCAEALAAHVR